MNKIISYLLFLPFVLNAQVINTVAGTGVAGFSGDGGQAVSAMLDNPGSIAVDAFCNVYLLGRSDHRIRKINSSGIITTIAGSGVAGYSGDGGQAILAQINWPTGITTDLAGNIYFTDGGNGRIRKIDLSGIITTICGNGFGSGGDGGAALNAQVGWLNQITTDKYGNIYFSDAFNNSIRKINLSGIITKIVGGSWGYSGDGGPASAAAIAGPSNLVIDSKKSILFVEQYNHIIRTIDSLGVISTLAGTGLPGFSGDGGLATLAELYYPTGIAVDTSGNILITDNWNHRVRSINKFGIINTIAGNGTPGFSGDGGLANNAQLYRPSSLAIDNFNNILIADSANNRIRKIGSGNCISTDIKINFENDFVLYPNPASNILYIKSVQYFEESSEIEIVNYLDQLIFKMDFKNEIDVSQLSSGYYTLNIITPQKHQFHSKFIKE